MRQSDRKRMISLVLAVCLLLSCAACGGKGKAEAASMWLVKTEGAVAVTDSEGADVSLTDRLGLFSGYGVTTQTASYGWIDLDETKLTKMDENSDVAVQKDGKNLTLTVNSGSLFFNITEPLAEDETLEIRASTMVTAIRGTCGWVEVPDAEHMNVYILEGTVTCSAGNVTETVTAGQTAAISAGEGVVLVDAFSAGSIPGFVTAEVKEDEALAAAILSASGLDILAQEDEALVAPASEPPEPDVPAQEDEALAAPASEPPEPDVPAQEDEALAAAALDTSEPDAPIGEEWDRSAMLQELGYFGDPAASTMTADQAAQLGAALDQLVTGSQDEYLYGGGQVVTGTLICSAVLFDAGDGSPAAAFMNNGTIPFGPDYPDYAGIVVLHFQNGQLVRMPGDGLHGLDLTEHYALFSGYMTPDGSPSDIYQAWVYDMANGGLHGPVLSYTTYDEYGPGGITIDGASATQEESDAWWPRWIDYGADRVASFSIGNGGFGGAYGAQDASVLAAALLNVPTAAISEPDPIGRALEQYRTIVGQADTYAYGGGVPTGDYRYALVQMEPDDAVPALLLEQGTDEGLYFAYIFQYDLEGDTVIQSSDFLMEGTALTGGYRGGLSMEGDGHGICITEVSASTGAIDIRRATLDGSTLKTEAQWSGRLDQDSGIGSVPIDWHSTGDLSALDSQAPGTTPQPEIPETAEVETPLPEDGGRIVLTGTLDEYSYDQTVSLQGVPDPNAGWADTNMTYWIIVLDEPQTIEIMSGGAPGLFARETSMIAVLEPAGLEQYAGQHITFSIDPQTSYWQSDTSMPMGAARTNDIHVLG